MAKKRSALSNAMSPAQRTCISDYASGADLKYMQTVRKGQEEIDDREKRYQRKKYRQIQEAQANAVK